MIVVFMDWQRWHSLSSQSAAMAAYSSLSLPSFSSLSCVMFDCCVVIVVVIVICLRCCQLSVSVVHRLASAIMLSPHLLLLLLDIVATAGLKGWLLFLWIDSGGTRCPPSLRQWLRICCLCHCCCHRCCHCLLPPPPPPLLPPLCCVTLWEI